MHKISKWYQGHISENPSASRWGIFSFLVSVSLFFLALSPSFFAIYLTFAGGTIVVPHWVMYSSFVLFIVFGVFGLFIGVFAVAKAAQWLQNPPAEDQTLSIVRKLA